MKKMLVRVMLLSITTATSVSAGVLEPLSGLGSDRSTLTLEQIEVRTERLQASTTFSLLRFPDALQAPRRIFNPAIWRIIERAAREYDLDPMLLAGMIFIESYGDPLAKSPTGPAGIAQLTKSSARELGLSTNKRIRISAPGRRPRYKPLTSGTCPSAPSWRWRGASAIDAHGWAAKSTLRSPNTIWARAAWRRCCRPISTAR